jgi:hypothetical protein
MNGDIMTLTPVGCLYPKVSLNEKQTKVLGFSIKTLWLKPFNLSDQLSFKSSSQSSSQFLPHISRRPRRFNHFFRMY